MSSKANRNQGIQIIADFEDCAIPLNPPAGLDWSGKASRSANEGIRVLADFENDVQPLNGSETGTLDSLNTLVAQPSRGSAIEDAIKSEVSRLGRDLTVLISASDDRLGALALCQKLLLAELDSIQKSAAAGETRTL